MKNKPGEIDINDVFKKTYNRIAKWHNEVSDMPEKERTASLQTLTHLVIQDIGDKFGDMFGISINLGVSMSPEMRKKVDQIKRDEGFTTGDGRLKRMFESDSYLEED